MHTTTEVRCILNELESKPADAIESEVLECKSWDDHPEAYKTQLRELRETVVAFANARGGTIVLGIADWKRSRREAIQGVGQADANDIRRGIYDGTAPHILVDIEELIEPEGRLLLIHVPRGMPPHTTSDGVAKIRVGKETKPLIGPALSQMVLAGGMRDLTAQIPPDVRFDDLDPEQIKALRKIIAEEAENSQLARLSDEEMLANLGLARGDEVTLAAILLLGRPMVLARLLPQHEIIFLKYKTATRYEVRRDLKGPILVVLESLKQFIEANTRLTTIQREGFAEITIPDLNWLVVREAVLNALVHRDYFVHQSIHIELRPDELSISSPGGFIGGVSPGNILRHPPVRRNALLASVLQTAGLVNRAGLGVDRIFEETLKSGKQPPRYESRESFVKLTIPLATHPGFARFLAGENQAGARLELDDLIILRALCRRSHLDRWTAAEALQLDEESAAERLVSLRARKYLTVHGRGRGTKFQLTPYLSKIIFSEKETGQPEPLMDDEAVTMRVQALLQSAGKITNADVQKLSGYSRSEVVRLMRELVKQGAAVLHGRGRGAHYQPVPAQKKAKKK